MQRLVSSVRIFFSGAWLSYIALFRWTQPASYLASKVVMPLSQILFFTFLGMSATGRQTAEFYVVGNALQVAAVNGIYGVSMTVGRERNEGTLIYLLLFSGANIPLDRLPAWMQTVSTALPLTRGIQAARLLVGGASLVEVWPLLLGELAVGLVYALAGFALFSWFEAQARRRGTLEAF